MTNLSGKVAIITGGGRGLGREQALRLAAVGCAVVVNDVGCGPDGHGVDPSVAAGVVAEIEAKGGRALASTDDVSSPDAVERLVAATIATFGQVDILVAGAGIMTDAFVLDGKNELFSPMVEAAMRGTFLCVSAVARHLVGRNAPGRIIVTSSATAYRGMPGIPLYSAAKGGVLSFGLSVAQELRPHGITVNVLCPFALTRLTTMAFKDIPDAAEHFSPALVADVVAFLASDLSADITGTIVEVAGRQVSVVRVAQSEAQTPREGGRWTPEELAERWSEIASLAAKPQLSVKKTGRTG